MQALFAKFFAFVASIWLFQKLWKAFVNVVSLFVPLGKRVFYSRQLWWIVHIALIVAIFIALVWLQRSGRFVIEPPPQLAALRQYWLGILFLLLYSTSWIVWWIWKLLIDDVPSYHPDIDAAWEAAKAALTEQGIDLRNRPLFLVLGRPESGERNLWDAAQLKLEVKPTPADPRAPLRVCADAGSVYVTCAGVSLLGRLAGIFALEEMGQGEGA